MKMKKEIAVAYLRVSRKKQKIKGLSIEAQTEAIDHYCAFANLKIVKRFTEVESGKKMHRPVIEAALEFCKEHQAKLLISTLDRLTRRVLFVALLIESKVDFVAIDKPFADKYTTYVDAAHAEEEADRISRRTKAALQVAKSKGKKLGKFGKVLAKRNIKRSQAFIKRMKPILQKLLKQGIHRAKDIVAFLNSKEIRTYRKGGIWHIGSVYHLLQKM